MSKHTPGPWKVKQFADENSRAVIEAARWGNATPEWFVLLNCKVSLQPDGAARCTNDDVEETAANARLIAAAPDLLAACKAMLAANEDIRGAVPPGWIEADEALAAAIASAEGGAK